MKDEDKILLEGVMVRLPEKTHGGRVYDSEIYLKHLEIYKRKKKQKIRKKKLKNIICQ